MKTTTFVINDMLICDEKPLLWNSLRWIIPHIIFMWLVFSIKAIASNRGISCSLTTTAEGGDYQPVAVKTPHSEQPREHQHAHLPSTGFGASERYCRLEVPGIVYNANHSLRSVTNSLISSCALTLYYNLNLVFVNNLPEAVWYHSKSSLKLHCCWIYIFTCFLLVI